MTRNVFYNYSLRHFTFFIQYVHSYQVSVYYWRFQNLSFRKHTSVLLLWKGYHHLCTTKASKARSNSLIIRLKSLNINMIKRLNYRALPSELQYAVSLLLVTLQSPISLYPGSGQTPTTSNDHERALPLCNLDPSLCCNIMVAFSAACFFRGSLTVF